MNLLELKGVGFPETPWSIIQGVDLTIKAGECVVLFGPSGAGKHTLLKIAAGILRPSAGTVTVERAEKNALPLAYVPLDTGLISNLTLLQNTVLPLVYHRRMTYADSLEKGRAALKKFDLEDAADMRPAIVGAGHRRLAQFARAALIDPKLYLLEQPLSNIDAAAALAIKRFLRDLRARADAGTLLVTGTPGEYFTWGHRFIYKGKGALRFFASGKELAECEDPEIKEFMV